MCHSASLYIVTSRVPALLSHTPQNLEYKFVELLSVSFLRSSEAITREHISFRYQSARARLALVQARLNDVVTLVKVKNPSLLLSLSREGGAAAKGAAFPGGTATASFAPSGGGGGGGGLR